MANQIIACPHSLLAALRANMRYQKVEGTGILRFNPFGPYQSARAYAIQVEDPRLWMSETRSGNWESFVLLLTAEEQLDPACQPIPLPEDLVLEFLDRVVPELATIADLQGHDLLALAAAVDEARKAANQVPLSRLERPASNSYEENLCAVAALAQAQLGARLARFDGAYTNLRDDAVRQGMMPILRILGTQGAVADSLDLEASGRTAEYAMRDDLDLLRLFRHRRIAAGDCRALDIVLSGGWDHEVPASRMAKPDWLRWLFRLAEQRSGRDLSEFYWRNTQDAIGSDIPPAVKVDEISAAVGDFCTAFDRRLMGACHPVIRAALGLFEVTRIQPFPKDNARMARLVFIALLDSMGFWALPLPLALHRQRHALASMLEGSAEIGTPDHLIAFMMTVCEEALAAGKLMLHEAMQERQKLHDALTRAGVPSDRAVCTTLELLANAFVNTRHDTDFWNAAFQGGCSRVASPRSHRSASSRMENLLVVPSRA
ncbi:MAG: Fic family protein [Rhodospirillaceae bacterium]|nr:Fic family protein [Rhodospirillaceae bacterium]